MVADARSDPRIVIGLPIALTLLLSTLLVAFGLSAIHTAPRDVPLALVAPGPVAAQITAGVNQAQPGAFDLRVAGSPETAREMIKDREVYGALIVGAEGLRVVTASAASPAVAQIVTSIGQALGTRLGVPAAVEDVVPLPEDDPRGVGLSAGALPIALGGLTAGAAITMLVSGIWRRMGVMVAFAVLSGLVMTAVLDFWFGTLSGSYAATAAAAVLGVLATGMTVLGLEQLLGRPGIGLAALIVVVLGNPLSGLASAPEMLAQPWGAIGQLLPPGATGTLLRNVAFFDGAAIGRPLLVLAGWLALGLLAFWVGAVRSGRGAGGAEPQPAVA
jgi:hypothetical protein